MTELEKTARMALEALEELQGVCTDSPGGVEAVTIWTPDAIAALTQALATTEHLIYEDGSPGPAATTERKVEPVIITETQIASLEVAARAMEAIATKKMLVGDVIEPVRTINDAAKLAKMAGDRVSNVLSCLDLNKPANTSPQVPEGFALVPVEPTLKMQSAALPYVMRQHQTRSIWAAMLDAARKGE